MAYGQENWGVSMGSEIEAFIHYLEYIKKASKNTVVSYRRDLLQLASYLEEQGIHEPAKVTKTSLNSLYFISGAPGKGDDDDLQDYGFLSRPFFIMS